MALGAGDEGVVVTSVADGSTAAAEGIRAGDVIQTIDGAPMPAPGDVVAAIGRHASGARVTIDLRRDGRMERRDVVLRPFPRETMQDATVEYGSIALDDGTRLRTILSVPTGAMAPTAAVMLVQGGGCGSVDMPMLTDVGQVGLVHTIGAAGFVTLRVEKSGVGDSQGPPCDTIGYEQELAGYRAGLRVLTEHPAVDPERVFLVGISLGGVFAPVLARQAPLAGIVVYGTLVSAPGPYPGRHERFFEEFASVDVPVAWATVETPVLVLHGEYDDVTTGGDHARIAAIVNAVRPGLAEHRELERLDHCWTEHATMEASRGRCGAGASSTAMPDAVLAFLRRHR